MKRYRVPVSKRIYGYVEVIAVDEYDAKDQAWKIMDDSTFVPDMDEFDIDHCGGVEEIDSSPNAELWR